ncbi:MAG TPA: hypothetical protein VFJ51_05505, partial [Nitrososphaeraceae archaeon]|nr:hypothetical protein [Nitrososphaeraceae archaeon]
MIPVNEDLIVNAVERVGKAVVNIASVRTIHDQLFRVFPVEGVGLQCYYQREMSCTYLVDICFINLHLSNIGCRSMLNPK